tara:strand:- start:4 stop:195 length:192 start_codon:yes stop_codon:yes gene_type:complete
MSKITTIGDWRVYKTTNWGTSWNWVAMHKDTVIDNFPTKKKAIKFIELETLLENMQKELPNDR